MKWIPPRRVEREGLATKALERFYFDDNCPRCAPVQLLEPGAWVESQVRQANAYAAYVKLREAGRDLDQLDGLEDADLELLREVARHVGHGPAPADDGIWRK